MATWTNPRTWVTNEIVTAALLNTHLRDNLLAIGQAWTAYGSGSSWTSSGTAPALGNGTWSASYMQAGKLVIGRIKMTLGSTSTVGTGGYRFAIPVAASTSIDDCVGSIVYNDLSGAVYAGSMRLITSTTIGGVQGQSTAYSATSPVTPATGDIYAIQFTYEAA